MRLKNNPHIETNDVILIPSLKIAGLEVCQGQQ